MEEKTEQKPVKKKRRIFVIFLYILAFVILVPIFISLLLQVRSVQNFVVDQSTSYLGEKFNGEIIIGDVDFNMRYGLDLNDFLLIDENRDTIINAESLTVALESSLLSLYHNELNIKNIHLKGPKINIVKEKGETENNLTVIVNKLFTTSSTPSSGERIKLDVKDIKLSALDLRISDFNKNEIQQINVKEGRIMINSLDDNGDIDIALIKLTNPLVRLYKEGNTYTSDIQEENVKEIAAASQSNSSLNIAKIDVVGGIFSLDDKTKSRNVYNNAIDYSQFEFSDIKIDATDFYLENKMDILLNLNHFSFKDKKGFSIQKLASQNISINSKEINLPEFRLESDNSLITNRVKLSYNSFDDFKDFENKVQLSASFRNSKVSINELLHFIHNLNSKKIFTQNRNNIVNLSGYVDGTVNSLKGKNLKVDIYNKFALAGDFETKNIAVKGKEYLSIKVDSMLTDMKALQEIIPGFSPPDNFYKLNNIRFEGLFEGLIKDFRANGYMQTALGSATLNMRLDSRAGQEEATYSGDIDLNKFDLKTWTGNDNLGILDITGSIKEGQGLTGTSASAVIDGVINNFEFKGYEYKDFNINGSIDKNQFNGIFSIKDVNVDMLFDGNIEINDNIPLMAFDASINKLDLYKLNLINRPFAIDGDFQVDMEGNDIDNLIGEVYARNINLQTNDTIYSLDTLSANINQLQNKQKKLNIHSEIFDVEIAGDYSLKTIVPTVRQVIRDDYPVFLKNWPVNVVDTTMQDISIDINIKDSKNLLELAGLKESNVQNIQIKGDINTDEGKIDIRGVIPFIKILNNQLVNSSFTFINENHQGSLELVVDSTNIDGFVLNPVIIKTDVKDQILKFAVNTENVMDSVQRVDLGFTLTPENDGYDVTFDDDKMVFLGKEWAFHPLNKLYFDSNTIDADKLILSDGKRSIIVDDLNGKKGVNINFDDFNLLTLNGLINFKKMKFSGEGDLNFSADNIFEKSPSIFGSVKVDTFGINGDNYGALSMKFIKPRDENIDLNVRIAKDDYDLNLLANLNPNTKYLEAKVTSQNFPLEIFEFIILNGIRDTYGGVDLTADITGPLDQLKIDGTGYLMNAGTTIIYTGVDYHFSDQKVTVTEDLIDVTGAKIFDRNENFGVLTGGLKHRYFEDFELDVNISGDDVIALNTSKGDNPTYYGYGQGAISVDFEGPFHRVNMKIDCLTKSGSVLNIPIQSSQSNVNENFITFIKKESLNEEDIDNKKEFRLEGIDIEMDLSLTPEAQVNLIFDESRGDIIEGRGRGNLKLYITRYGDFNIYGNYDITSGKYLFTAFGLVAKPFKVRRGGQVKWTGDPINASLNIVADYSVRTPVYTFLREYLTTPRLEGEANNKTDVNLKLKLGNKLYNPTVEFDLEFPSLTGELKSVADSKMRTLESNQSELNNQVLGLIVFNSFLPSSSLSERGGSANISQAGISTLSEFVSSQLSILFTGLINEALSEDGLVSGIDFDIGLKKNSFYGFSSTSNDLLPDEIEVHLKNKFRFLDERLSLNVGGNYVRAPIRNIQEYFIGDFVLEYFLTEDRKLKLRMYGKYDYDEAVADRKLRYGLGLGYRTEFGSLTQFKDEFKNDLREIIEEEQSTSE